MSSLAANPSYPQKLAASPDVSAWVSASAGTGKTKVLTDRLLNLMLTGQDPAKILCLTFTKAAAAEMQARLFQRLSSWVQMDDAQLLQSLEDLWQGPVTVELQKQARSLFTQVIDLPGGIKIQTIHGFCQTVLGRFPLEAKIPAQFSIIDDARSAKLLRTATAKILDHESKNHPDLFKLLAIHYKDKKFEETLDELLSYRRELRHLSQYNITSYERHLKETLGFSQDIRLLDPDTRSILIGQASTDGNYDRAGLLSCLNDKPHIVLEKWLSGDITDRVELYDAYVRLFLTANGDISKRPVVKHEVEAERLYRLNKTLNLLEIAQKSIILFVLGAAIYECYQHQKLKESTLDYDDLVDKTINLLTDPELAAWVLYKLDGGIDHILVDEAQDTNPAQWDVIRALTQDFFRVDKVNRTLFVVGDSKQSIYSFQGANPDDFIQLREFFAVQSQNIGQTWRNVDLSVSFRSTPEILNLVDYVFADKTMQTQLLTETNLVHTPFRHNHQGKVHLWPVLTRSEDEEKTEFEPWQLPNNRIDEQGLDKDYANLIGKQIQHLLASKIVLPSTQRPIQPKDILILVRHRSEFINHLIQSLKHYHVSVAGADRFVLSNHLAVKDLLSLGQFLLQPLDDLSLANVLVSPLIGLSHDDLMNLAIGREGALWTELVKQNQSPRYQSAYLWLKEILNKTDYLSPFDLYAHLLYNMEGKKRILARLSHEAEDVINEFLNLLLNLEQQTSPSLELVIGEILSQQHELKRDSADNQYNEVRLMTIHGSKGLQAPVVIIVERFSAKSPTSSILWQFNDQQECNLLLAAPSKAQDTNLTQILKGQVLSKEEAEDKRLLYVALTRAQDHLYVGGFGNKMREESWYSLLESKGVMLEPWQSAEMENWPAIPKSSLKELLPEFLRESVDLSRYLKPCEAKESMSEVAHRGIIVHKLLEVLPDLSSGLWLEKGQQLVQTLTSDKTLQRDCLDMALSVLQSPRLHEFFGVDSVAELELVAEEGNLLRLDRVVLGKTIKVLDYKSSQNPPIEGTPTPFNIAQQLQTYHQALSQLYPDKTIECYVLWTSTGRLDHISLAVCDTRGN